MLHQLFRFLLILFLGILSIFLALQALQMTKNPKKRMTKAKDKLIGKDSMLHIVAFLFSANLLIPAAHGRLQPSHKDAALFVFGDSLYDSGNNDYINTTTNFQANFKPYGMTYFKYPTGRFSDGRLVPDFIAQYAKLPLIKPYLEPGFHDYFKGVNFASAGAGSLVETNRGFVIDLGTQVKYFKHVQKVLSENLGPSGAKMLLSKSVYLFSIGTNDYAFPFLRNTTMLHSYSNEDYVGMVIGNVTKAVKEIYISGGRKFGFMNLWSSGCSPGIRAIIPGGTCPKDLHDLAQLHNKALHKILQKLEQHLKGFKYSIFDSDTFFSERMNSPSKYGFKEAKMACCGSGPYRGFSSCGGKRANKDYELCDNPNKYLFFDSSHPTQKACKQLAELMWGGDVDIVGPYNLKTLFKLG